jgi:tight adherence protein C
MTLLGLGISVSLTVIFFVYAVLSSRSKETAEKRLLSMSGRSGESARGPVRSVSNFDEGDTWQERLIRFATRLASRRTSSRRQEKVYETVSKRLAEAGFRRPSALSAYMGSRIALSGGLAGLVILTSLTLRMPPPIVLIFIAAAIGYVFPGLFVDNIRKKRQEEISRGLSDAIDLMVVCIEAGLGLGATLKRVADEFEDNNRVIAEEFQATVAETRAGRGLMDALHGLSTRNGNKELNLLVSLLVQTDRFGTPMVDALRTQGDAMRIDRMTRAEAAAQTAPVKMMVPSSLILFAVLLILGAPAVIHLSEAFKN